MENRLDAAIPAKKKGKISKRHVFCSRYKAISHGIMEHRFREQAPQEGVDW